MLGVEPPILHVDDVLQILKKAGIPTNGLDVTTMAAALGAFDFENDILT